MNMSEMESLKVVPKGVDNFKKLRDEDFYYVDKTELISDILSNKSEVFLFTRPRRFGKSLNLSMLDAFFNMKYKGNTWFNGLKISEHDEVTKHKNAYPVINLCMKDCAVEEYNSFLDDVRGKVDASYRCFPEIYKNELIPESVRQQYLDIYPYQFNESRLRGSIKALCEMITTTYGVKPIVLIDEYDNSINNSFNQKDHNKILAFLRYFYSSTLKGNENMSFAVVTGVMQIAKESIFSGLNNLSVNNIFSRAFDERYGFTPDEVKEICSYYGHPEKFEEAKDWYDGYRFGNAEIYNPWSILAYIKNGFEPDKYWTGTSGNDIINSLLNGANSEVYRELKTLIEGGTINKTIQPTVAMVDLNVDRNAVYSIMAVAGYLNAVPSPVGYDLSIPNLEMRDEFSTITLRCMGSNASQAFKQFFYGVENKDLDYMKMGLDTIFMDNVPFFVLSDETDYELILAGVAMCFLGRYKVALEKENGNGRADIILWPNSAGLPNIVVELKRTNSNDEEVLMKEAEGAIKQIKDKKYYRGMKGRTILYGICFQGKDSKIVVEEENL